MAVRQQSKHELAAALQGRYVRAGRKEKGQILDEFVAATGYHRKWALGRLRQGPPPARRGCGGRPRLLRARHRRGRREADPRHERQSQVLPTIAARLPARGRAPVLQVLE